jgi:2-polyprenyl-3-methyl-5-hydroxy-6-metoxy-1,4-benzoquinol methylase
LPDGYFDLVIANDVIEHIADTEAFLAILTKKLAPDGLIALSVPNARQIRLTYHVLIRGTFPRTDAGLFDRTHLRWFCKRDVIALCSACGLTMTDSQSVGRLVPRWISRAGVAEFLALQNLFVFRHK